MGLIESISLEFHDHGSFSHDQVSGLTTGQDFGNSELKVLATLVNQEALAALDHPLADVLPVALLKLVLDFA